MQPSRDDAAHESGALVVGAGAPAPATNGAQPRALLLDDARFDAHAPRAYHPERPERLTAAREAIAKARVSFEPLAREAVREATDDEIARVHHPEFVTRLEKLRGHEGHIDPDTYIGKESIGAARLAAGGLVSLVDAMIDGPIARAVALVRPPGHHARPGAAMGFCLINNVAVAAAHARARGLSRVMIVDWDVHHGNGTQEIFFEDASVLYVSTHQFPFYPGTGDVDERGEKDGEGYTLNVPLSAGGGDAVYRSAFERVILPVAEAYAPELVLVSAGFDPAARDPLAQMELSADAFGWMSRELTKVADRSAKGRIALVLEGGYDLVSLEAGLLSSIEGMTHAAALDIAADPDAPDIGRAAAAAKATWKLP